MNPFKIIANGLKFIDKKILDYFTMMARNSIIKEAGVDKKLVWSRIKEQMKELADKGSVHINGCLDMADYEFKITEDGCMEMFTIYKSSITFHEIVTPNDLISKFMYINISYLSKTGKTEGSDNIKEFIYKEVKKIGE